ncbi:hypothetical protein BDA96_07G120000 [Sorghum bicolor]|nr:uncharacterized protein LOC110437085 [Sorghum bicolor]KAG0523398.1 hypothetical protein BDA96_07G120000 [Sorghum bicolor]|eukprot:XP_021320936.1 uncharacterized protein LOC110437085 [Sorghum bicolor]
MAIYAASFVSLEDALSSPNNTQVDLIAVVAHVGLWDCQTLFPNSFREVALKDNSRIGFLRVFAYDAEENYHMFFSAGTENYFLIPTNVVVDSYARCLTMTAHSSMIFVGPREYCPIFASLEAIRDEMRNIACYNDQIKIALNARANEIKRLEYNECTAMANNQGVISYVNGCNI